MADVDRIRRDLLSALLDAAHPDTIASDDDLRAAGVPKRWRDSLRRASKHANTTEAMREVAADYAERIAADIDADTALGTDPRKLADRILGGR